MSGLNIGNFSFEVIGAPVFAIVAGMIITALFSNLAGDESVKAGITFTSKKILQWAVIILGFMLNIKLFFPSAEKACLLLLQQLQHHSLLHI